MIKKLNVGKQSLELCFINIVNFCRGIVDKHEQLIEDTQKYGTNVEAKRIQRDAYVYFFFLCFFIVFYFMS